MKLIPPVMMGTKESPVLVTKPEVPVAGGPQMVRIKSFSHGHYVSFHGGFTAHEAMRQIGGKSISSWAGVAPHGYYYFSLRAASSVEELIELLELVW